MPASSVALVIAIRLQADRARCAISREVDAERGKARYVRRVAVQLPRADIALAAALFAVKIATLATGIQSGAGAVSYIAAIGLTLPFAWRSRRPVEVAAIVSASAVAEVAIGGYHNSVISLFAWLLASYSLGAHATSAARLAAGFAVTAAAGIWVAVRSGPVTFWNLVAVVGLLVASLVAGLWVRQTRLRAQALAQLAAQLERERDERARTAVAEERARIARELHDEVAHAMSVIAVQADAAEGALAHDPALVERPLSAIRDTARGALADMRRVLGAVRGDEAASYAPEPGLARVGALVEQTRAAGLDVDVRIVGEPSPLPPALDVAAYRVLQEGLTNVRKHAGARRVEIVIRYARQSVEVEVRDDGDGGGPGGGSGRGLAGLRERVGLLGGEFAAGPRADGFALCVRLPLA
jgi:signal transduction histidine kinase